MGEINGPSGPRGNPAAIPEQQERTVGIPVRRDTVPHEGPQVPADTWNAQPQVHGVEQKDAHLGERRGVDKPPPKPGPGADAVARSVQAVAAAFRPSTRTNRRRLILLMGA